MPLVINVQCTSTKNRVCNNIFYHNEFEITVQVVSYIKHNITVTVA